jgi:carbamoyl-phosphate synthase large subunit
MSKIRIGVTGINAVDNPGPGVGVIRSVKEDGELDVEAIGLAYDAMDPGVYMDWLVDRAYILPYPSGNEADFLSRIRYIKGETDLDLLVPTLDTELPVFINAAKELEEMGIRTFLPTKSQYDLRNKTRLEEVAANLGLAYPASRTVTSHQELAGAIEALGFPVMIKGLFYRAHCATTWQQAAGFFDSVVAEWGYPVIVQQVVTGDEMNVIGVGDGKGGDLGQVAIKKLCITSLGKIWTGVTVRNERVLKASREFVGNYRWKGGFELECIAAADDVYLIEINPRFPAWVYFATGVGVNLPARLVRAALDLPVERNGDYEAGKLYVRYTYDLVTDLSMLRSVATKAERS